MTKEELLADLNKQIRDTQDTLLLLQGALQGINLALQIDEKETEPVVETEAKLITEPGKDGENPPHNKRNRKRPA